MINQTRTLEQKNVNAKRLQSEQEFHDLQAADRAKHFAMIRSELAFQDDDYLKHESWIKPAFQLIQKHFGGNLKHRTVLDYGCGHGMAAVVFARAKAIVSAFDLSLGYLTEVQQRAEANDVSLNLCVANGEQLPFADNSFDVIWGSAILHHLDLEIAGQELKRVLKPNGIAVFCEPWGGNPLLTFARNHLPYLGKHRTPDEQPLTQEMLLPLMQIFQDVKITPFQLLGMISRAMKSPWLGEILSPVDRCLFKGLPFTKNWSRYAVVSFVKLP